MKESQCVIQRGAGTNHEERAGLFYRKDARVWASVRKPSEH